MSFLIGAIVFLLGISLGSFASVVAYRLPLGESIVRPGSRCPSCKKSIANKYNVPILGYILTKGKCASCGEGISVRYLLLEVGMGLAFVAIDLRSPTYWLLPSYFVLTTGLVIISLIDIQNMTIPRKILYPVLFFGIPWLFLTGLVKNDLNAFLHCIIAGVVAFLLFAFLFMLIPKGIGFGDVRLIGVSSFYLGWLGYKDVLLSIILGIILGGLFALFLLITKKVSAKSKLALGPFLSLGTFIVILYGPSIVKLWWH